MFFIVTAVAHGEEAISLIGRDTDFSLVLTDYNMPVMNGISLVSKLRRLDNYVKTPILMVTTEDAAYKKEKSRKMGANGWIQKPLDEDRLKKAVNSILSK